MLLEIFADHTALTQIYTELPASSLDPFTRFFVVKKLAKYVLMRCVQPFISVFALTVVDKIVLVYLKSVHSTEIL